MTDFAQARLAMVNSQVRPNDVTDQRIQDAMGALPREVFLPKAERTRAYADVEVRLSEDRVALRPMHLAKLIEAADIKSTDIVLDIACARGYSSAVLAQLAETVVGLEAEGSGFAAKASERLPEVGADNAVIVEGNLQVGAPEHGPFDVIVVNGAVTRVPQAWFEQLADLGRMVVIEQDGPVGRARLYTKVDGRIGERSVFDAAATVLPGFEPRQEFVF